MTQAIAIIHRCTLGVPPSFVVLVLVLRCTALSLFNCANCGRQRRSSFNFKAAFHTYTHTHTRATWTTCIIKVPAYVQIYISVFISADQHTHCDIKRLKSSDERLYCASSARAHTRSYFSSALCSALLCSTPFICFSGCTSVFPPVVTTVVHLAVRTRII